MDISYDYAVELDGDNDDDDKVALDNLFASMPGDVNREVLETIILEIIKKLANILRIKPGIHHIVQIIQYANYRIKVQVNNETWEPPSQILSSSTVYDEDMIYYYIA